VKESPVTLAKRHQPRLVLSEDVHAKVHGSGATGRFNTWLAVRITRTVGTMWTAYLFACISLISLPAALHSGDVIVIVSWVAQTFLQLVLLPIIIVGQNVISAAQDARAEADHETLTALHQMSLQQIKILEGQNEILDLLRQKAG